MPPKKGKDNGSQKKARRNWSKDEISKILEFMKNTIEMGGKIEKPNARAYYQKMVDSLGLPNCNSVSVINKMNSLKGSYDSAIKWRSATGQGVDEGTVKDKLQKLCPYFDDMDEIYSERVSLNPPYVSESSNEEDNQNDLNDLNDSESIQSPQSDLESDDFHGNGITSPTASPTPAKKSKCVSKAAPKNSEYSIIVSARQNIQREEIAVESKKVDLDQQKLQLEEKFKTEQLEIERKRLDHEVISRNDEFDFKRDQLKFEKEKSERDYELEKFRIEQNVKLQIELARINKG